MARGLGASKENNDLENNDVSRKATTAFWASRHFTMPPRTNAKKAKAEANAEDKANAKIQAEAVDTMPSFDVDESVAAAVHASRSASGDERSRCARAGCRGRTSEVAFPGASGDEVDVSHRLSGHLPSRHFTMPPRTNAKKAKAEANAEGKANAKIQAEAVDTMPSFDVDESVAAAVLAHVSSPRDRLALACVSSVWKNAVTSEGAWGTCDLVLDGELGKRLTDERFGRLLCYCGDVKHLEVCDAPAAEFEGNFLSDEGIAAKFASLESFKLTNCSGVDCTWVVDFMEAIGMPARPKDKRLRCLHLAGCVLAEMEFYHIETLNECLTADRDDMFLEQGEKRVPSVIRVQNKANLDLWWCESECERVVTTSAVKICNICKSAFCVSCAEGSSCDGCGEFICSECEFDDRFEVSCHGCGDTFCQECLLSMKISVCRGGPCSDKEGTNRRCFKAYCEPCRKKENIIFGMCSECFGVWCSDCAYDKDGPNLNCCFGKGGCYKTMCGPCGEKTNQFYPFCSKCNEGWCPDCDPGVDFYYPYSDDSDFFCPTCAPTY